MASKSIICCVITILLVNTNTVFALDLPESFQRVQRAILSENPTIELNNLINQDLSRSSVQSYVKSLIPEPIDNLRRSAASEDLLENLVTRYAEDPRVKEAASNSDLQSVLDVFNYEIGGAVLVISNNSVVIDVNALTAALRTFTSSYIQAQYPNNIYLQIVANAVVDEQIRLLSVEIQSIVAGKGIPVEVFDEIISLVSDSNREKRDLVTDLILAILRPQIVAIVTPIQTEFNNNVNSVLTVILNLYTATAQTDPIWALVTSFVNTAVLRVAEVIVVFQTDINTLFDNLINGTIVITARKRRDIDLEFENLYNLENVALELSSHRRVTRDIVSDIFTLVTNPISFIFSAVVTPITSIFNGIVKNVFIAILSSQYATIGNIVTLPLRAIVNALIDFVLPCSVCTSIV